MTRTERAFGNAGRLAAAVAGVLMWLAASSASAQDYAVVYVDPADGVQKVRVPTSQARPNTGLQWSLTQRGKAVAYNSDQIYASDNPQAYSIFAFFSYDTRPKRPTIANPLDPYAFVYERAKVDEDSEETVVQRIALKWADYERWTEERILELMQNGAQGGGGAPATNAFGAGAGAAPQASGGADPRAAAEWTHYFNQLTLWEEYITEEIFGVGYLDKMADFAPPRDPATARELMPFVYEDLLRRRDEMMADVQRENLEFYQRLQRRQEARERYEEWRIEQQDEILAFAEVWGRRARGAEIVVEGTPFIISAEPDPTPPKDGVFVVNESQLLTPYDILSREGELKKVYAGEGR